MFDTADHYDCMYATREHYDFICLVVVAQTLLLIPPLSPGGFAWVCRAARDTHQSVISVEEEEKIVVNESFFPDARC